MHSHQETFSNFVATALNEPQRQAVTPAAGVFLVCAGAGSGKTRTITARITNLILNEQVAPHSVVALTFTNKAAREMRSRVERFLPPETPLPFIGTFHGYCLRILKSYRHLLAIPDFTILDDSDQETIARSLIKKHELGKRITPRQLLANISHLKNRVGGRREQEYQDPIIETLYHAYEQEKARAHSFDFDDLLLEVLKLFTTNENFKAEQQQRIRHVVVDEYQDTNQVQHALLQAMTTHENKTTIHSLCVVGDEDQSIYSWRGATVTNFVNFAHDFPEAVTVTIEQNYRSTQPILAAANEVIKHNTGRTPKNLWSERQGTDRIRVFGCSSPAHEATVTALCAQLLKRKGKLVECAVLYRSHYQSRALEEALITHAIPYKIIGGTQFYDRQEIKDLLAYLRFARNPFDRVAFMRSLGTPSRGFGEKFFEQFFGWWDQQPFLDAHQVAAQYGHELSKSKQQTLLNYFDLVKKVAAQPTAREALEQVLSATNYIEYLRLNEETEQAQVRIENVKELMTAIIGIAARDIITLSDFLDEVTLLQDQIAQAAEQQDYIQLMTLHSAKGLEFDLVILTGLEEGVLPSTHASYQPETLEEERRLLYVGITRAREHLLLTSCSYRTIYGTLHDQRPSRFMSELPATIKRHDCTSWNRSDFVQQLTNWLFGGSSLHSVESDQLQTAIAALHAAQKTTAPTQAPSTTQAFVRPIVRSSAIGTAFSLGQTVEHTVFGRGIVEQIQELGDSTRLTIKFVSGSKKIAANFVRAL